jgi:hypothetical protein
LSALSNLTGGDPAQLWAFYLQLTEVEQAFNELKGDLAIRPIYHQTDERIEVRPDKSDRSDVRGLAEMVRVGWFKAVQVKSLTSHERKALLIARHQLVEMRVRIDNQLRGILKTFGLVIGICGHGQIGQRAQELAEGGIQVSIVLSPP